MDIGVHLSFQITRIQKQLKCPLMEEWIKKMWYIYIIYTMEYCAMLCLVTQSCPTLSDPMDLACQAPLSLGILQARLLEQGAIPFSRGSSNPRIEPRSPALQVGSLPAKPSGKPKNPGLDNLSLLQGNFLTQKLNWGVLHCRWILYQLSYQESPLLK